MEQPIRVAQVLNRMDSGGVEAVVMNYYRHIDRKQVQFDFYFAKDSVFPQREELEKMGAGIYPIPSYTKVFSYHRVLHHAFKRGNYQIVHAHLSTMSVFPLFAAWRAGIPVRICHNHSTAHWGEGKKTLLKYLLRPFAKVFATDYFACGEKAGRWMYGNRCFERGHVHVMPNAIDTKKFAYDEEAKRCLRAELDIPQDAFVLGHVGRFTYAKNHGFLLKVMECLKTQGQDVWLLLVGKGELEQTVKQQANACGLAGRVIFSGARTDVNKLYSAMDVFCLPSFYEGLPVVALEAQANGLPCLFSDRMTKEVVLTPGARQLSIENPEPWVKAVQEAQRQNICALPQTYDISSAGKWLQNYYFTRGKDYFS